MSTAKPLSQTTVVVGMSGGVDSSVTALLLKQQGYRVIAMFMKNWEERDEQGVCQSAEDFKDVVRVCEKLEIPYYSIEFVKEYWDGVFEEFLRDYQAGYTPNPDILCNREIKFKVFLQKAMDLGADFLATGHYARRVEGAEGLELHKGLDNGKDQTYFIYTLNQEILSKVLFPIGDLPKPEVRKLAEAHGLPTHDKKDSTGICFIGERNFPEFLGRYIKGKPGPFKSLAGETVGRHAGVMFYTLGQRRGLALGGEGDRWYVVGKDVANNTVYVERGDDHPALWCDELTATEISWVGKPPVGEGESVRVQARVRYRQPDQACEIFGLAGGRLRVVFDQPQRAVTPRQSVVFYSGTQCLGGAIIERAGASYWEQGRKLEPGQR